MPPKRIILRPGHGLTAPAGDIDYSPGESGYKTWIRQRPALREDDYTAEFCEYLVPALNRLGHCVYCMRAIDPVTGQLDRTMTTVGRETLPGLRVGQETTQPRWLYNAAVEGALRGSKACRDWDGSPWVHDPAAACLWEREIPNAGDGKEELYLSIHQNWWHNPKMFGFNSFYWGRGGSSFSRAGKVFATNIYNAVCSAYSDDEWAHETRLPTWREQLKYRRETGSRWSCTQYNLGELRMTRRPAVLLELGFMSNSEDSDRMHDPDWCHKMAEAIARGLAR